MLILKAIRNIIWQRDSNEKIFLKLLMAFILLMILNNCGIAFMTSRSNILNNATEEEYGLPIPENHEELTKELFEMILRDPESARYKFGDKGKDAIQKAFISPTAIAVRYQIVFINAKNAYGGYTGMKKYTIYWKDGRIYAYQAQNDIITYMQ